MKSLLHADVTQPSYYDSEMGQVKSIYWGKVVRQTPKSIWIKDNHKTEKWTIQADGKWKDSLHGIKRNFEFNLDPLLAFVFEEKA